MILWNGLNSVSEAAAFRVHLLGLYANWTRSVVLRKEEHKRLRTARLVNLRAGTVMTMWRNCFDKIFQVAFGDNKRLCWFSMDGVTWVKKDILKRPGMTTLIKTASIDNRGKRTLFWMIEVAWIADLGKKVTNSEALGIVYFNRVSQNWWMIVTFRISASVPQIGSQMNYPHKKLKARQKT